MNESPLISVSNLDFFLNNQQSLVMTAFRTYTMGLCISAAFGTGPQCGNTDGVMRPSHSGFRS
jgi:hypothetical protein